MSAVKLQEYVGRCGIEGVVVDNETLLLSTSGIHKIGDFKDGERGNSLDYFVNLKCPYRTRRKNASPASHDVYEGEGGVFIVQSENKRLAMFVPIYELHCSVVRGSIVSITGHEESATVLLNDLHESFCHHTR